MRIVPPDERFKRGRRFLVGYVGVMGRQEGLDDLLRAVQWIVHELGRHDIQFALVGSGTSLPELRALAAAAATWRTTSPSPAACPTTPWWPY